MKKLVNVDQLVCPISSEKMDNQVSRTTALMVSCMLMMFVFTGHSAFLLVTLFEFAIRVFVTKNSPFVQLSNLIVRWVKLPVKLIDSAPKVFASRMGLICTAVSTVLYLSGLPIASFAVALVLVSLASLHAVFNYCVGCWLYHYIVLPFFEK